MGRYPHLFLGLQSLTSPPRFPLLPLPPLTPLPRLSPHCAINCASFDLNARYRSQTVKETASTYVQIRTSALLALSDWGWRCGSRRSYRGVTPQRKSRVLSWMKTTARQQLQEVRSYSPCPIEIYNIWNSNWCELFHLTLRLKSMKSNKQKLPLEEKAALES